MPNPPSSRSETSLPRGSSATEGDDEEDFDGPRSVSGPVNEAQKLELLASCRLLDTEEERDFDDLTRLASMICETPVATITLVDRERQWFQSRLGDSAGTSPRVALCAAAILEPDQILLSPDTSQDPRFARNELVSGNEGVRFYGGVPLLAEDGTPLGTLCVMDVKPRTLNARQLVGLAALGRQAVALLELRRRDQASNDVRLEREQFFSLPLDMLCVAGNDGYFRKLNPAFSEALGYTSRELLAQPFISLVHPDDVEATKTELARLARGLPTLDFENRYRRKDGNYRWLSWRCAPTLDGLIYASVRDITKRRESEEGLLLHKALVKQFVKHAPAAIAMLDREMRYLQVSDRWRTDYHLGSADLIGKSHYEVFPDVPQRWKDSHQRVLTGEVERCDEDPFPRADGGTEWLQWEARPWFSAPGEIGGLIFFTQVITARKETEARFQAMSELQRAILHSAAHAIIATTPEGIITVFNPAAERMLGYSESEVVEHETPEIFHDAAEVAAKAAEFGAQLGIEIEPGFEVFAARCRRRLPCEYEWTYVRKDGRSFPVQLSLTALWDESGRITGFLGIAVDITERKRAEARLLGSEKRFREAIEHSAIGMALVGLDGGWLKVNRALCDFLGRTEAELRECSFQTITHPDDLNADLANVRELLTGKITHYQMEKRYLHKSGRAVWAHLAVTLVRDSQSEPLYFVSQIKDVTEQRQAEARLKASLAEKESLLQEIHHRVKNNLQIVSSLLSLQSGYIKDPQMLIQFQECQGRIRSMALIHEKLYQSETLSSVDLKDYLNGLCRIVMSAYATKNSVRLELVLDQVNTTIDTAVPIGLLVNELLTNSVKYAFPENRPGYVRVTLRKEEGAEFTLLVEDNGVGLPPNFQLEKARTLGMRLVGIFVKQMRAQMSYETGTGQTCFTFRVRGALEPMPESGNNNIDPREGKGEPDNAPPSDSSNEPHPPAE